jgi:hypothetical protein
MYNMIRSEKRNNTKIDRLIDGMENDFEINVWKRMRSYI